MHLYIIECYIREYPNSGCFINIYINYDIFQKNEFKYYKNYFWWYMIIIELQFEKKIRAIKNNYSYQLIEESIELSSQLIESDINSQILIVLVYILQVQIFVMICYDSFTIIPNLKLLILLLIEK